MPLFHQVSATGSRPGCSATRKLFHRRVKAPAPWRAVCLQVSQVRVDARPAAEKEDETVPRPLTIINAFTGLLSCLFVAGLIREAVYARPMPAPPALRARQPAAAPTPVPSEELPAVSRYGVIAAKNLFSPTRTEEPTRPTVAEGPKPVLHGVVMDGDKSRAYLEDPVSRRAVGYGIGDTVGSGRIHSINADRVVIIRPETRVEVLLHDPSKPRTSGSQPVARMPSAFPVPTTAGATAGPPAPREKGDHDEDPPVSAAGVANQR